MDELPDGRPAALPETVSDLYDLLREKFGIGEHDDIAGGGDYWRARAVEIGKLKRILARRRTTPAQLGKAVWFAEHTAKPIRAVAHLMPLVAPGIKAWREAEQELARTAALNQLYDVHDRALELGEHEFAERLLRADHIVAAGLIRTWLREHPEETR